LELSAPVPVGVPDSVKRGCHLSCDVGAHTSCRSASAATTQSPELGDFKSIPDSRLRPMPQPLPPGYSATVRIPHPLPTGGAATPPASAPLPPALSSWRSCCLASSSRLLCLPRQLQA